MSSAEAEKWVAVSVEVGKAGEALGYVAGGTFSFLFQVPFTSAARIIVDN